MVNIYIQNSYKATEYKDYKDMNGLTRTATFTLSDMVSFHSTITSTF